MITAQQIANQARAIGLDAEGTDYYDDTLHVIPAINAAVRWVLSVASVAISQKRLSEEALKGVIRLKVFQTSSLSRIKIGSEVYSILNVLPMPTCLPNSNPYTALNEYESYDLSSDGSLGVAKHFVSCDYNSCKRLSHEEWNYYKNNPFKAGNTFQDTTNTELTIYAYYSPLIYGQFGTPAAPEEGSYLEIRPALNKKLCAITFIETQTEVTALTDELNFDINFLNILAFKTTSFLTLKQGDFTTIHNVSENEVMSLLTAIT